jgi:hypothetical protein
MHRAIRDVAGLLLATGIALTACEQAPRAPVSAPPPPPAATAPTAADVSTWTARLDDPARRAEAIDRLMTMHEDAIVPVLTKQYLAGGLDDARRARLLQFVASSNDPRAQPALASALSSYQLGEPGIHSDDPSDVEVVSACASIRAMRRVGTVLEPAVVDAVWALFDRDSRSSGSHGRLETALEGTLQSIVDRGSCDRLVGWLEKPESPRRDDGMYSMEDAARDRVLELLARVRCPDAAKALVLDFLRRKVARRKSLFSHETIDLYEVPLLRLPVPSEVQVRAGRPARVDRVVRRVPAGRVGRAGATIPAQPAAPRAR